ncbi:Imidazolonepropionase [Streptomyces antimycoticus]
MIDGTGATPIPDAVVIADAEGTITYAGPAATAPPASGDAFTGRVIDAGGRTVLPGFFDCHTHLAYAHATPPGRRGELDPGPGHLRHRHPAAADSRRGRHHRPGPGQLAAQVIALFTWSNLGVLLAVKAAALFNAIGVTGFWAIIAFVLLASCLNLVILSGSALWSLVGPVFIPAFMLMDMSPALSQAAFRIGDSATGAITPMNPYLLLILAMVREYEPEARLGTLISRLAIFVVPFLVVWLAILGIFYGLDLPLGPGAAIGVK